MAVIELEESDEETTVVKDQTKQSPPPSSSSGPADSGKGKSESVPAGANGDDSDGFETASEREVSDEDQDGGEGYNFGDADRKPEQQPLLVNPVVEQPSEEKQPEKSEESPEGALNDDESKQKALSQANDAKTEGNKLFGEGQFENALSKYELALQLAPDMPGSVELQSICHSNRAICFLKLGKCDDAIKECTKALELNPSYIKALLRRGEAHEKLEHYEEAIVDLKKALELDPSDHQARRGIRRLEPLAAEKREKMKEEMMGKLKDMGNSILGRFGMSVDNFKAVKDPNTGSYSISFQR